MFESHRSSFSILRLHQEWQTTMIRYECLPIIQLRHRRFCMSQVCLGQCCDRTEKVRWSCWHYVNYNNYSRPTNSILFFLFRWCGWWWWGCGLWKEGSQRNQFFQQWWHAGILHEKGDVVAAATASATTPVGFSFGKTTTMSSITTAAPPV